MNFLKAIRETNEVVFYGSVEGYSEMNVLRNTTGSRLGITQPASKTKGTEVKTTKAVFRAYCPGMLVIQSASIIGSVGSGILGNDLMTAAMNIFGKSPASFDFPRKFLFKGTKPLEFQVPCFLILKNDVETDYKEPLKNLFQLAYPRRITGKLDEKVASSEAFKTALDMIGSLVETVVGWINKDTGSSWAESIKNPNWLTDAVGGFYALRMPSPLIAGDHYKNKLTLQYGKIYMDEVVISGLNFSIPLLTMGEGYPSYISIALTVESLRPVTADLMIDIIQ